MPIYAVDFETFWDSKDYTLSKMGPIEYIRDKRFAPQMMSVQCVDDPGQPYVWDNIKDRATVRHALEMLETSPNVSWCGHNMHGFDALIFSEHYGFHPHRILDTICMARWCGLARLGRESHEALTEMLGHGKKKAGTVVSNGKRWPDDFTPEEQAFFKQYCADDTSQCAANAAAMLPYMTDDALRFMSITARMATEPMFELDEEMLEGYIRELDAAAEKSRQELLGMFHFPDMASFLSAIRSSDRFAVMLRALGVEPPMKVSEAKTKTYFGKLQAQADAGSVEAAQALANAEPVMTYAFSKTDLDFLDLLHSDDPRVSLLVQTRLEHNSSIARSRAVTLLKFARDKRPVPVMLSTWKAATGRYSAGVSEGASDALQFQNLSKRDPSKLTLRRAIKAPKGRCIVAVDSSQVEARCLAFVANEVGLLTQFREGRDPYSELAETIFGVPWQDIKAGAKAGDKKMKMYRNTGKTGILSCLAGTVEVLTNTGWKRIDTVSVNDKVWDGVSWVKHEGLICNGWRNTINVAGIDMTPDHLVFDGSSWRMAAELLGEPHYLKSATEWASASYETVLLTHQKDIAPYGFSPHVLTAAPNDGIEATPWLMERLASCARTARHETLSILQVLRGVLKTLKSVPSSANSQFLTTTVTNMLMPMAKNVQSIVHWCSALAGQNLIGYYNPICVTDAQHVATPVPRKKPVQHKTKSTGSMQMWYRILRHVGGYLRVFLHVSHDAVRHRISVKPGNIMEAGVSESNFQTVEPFSSILSRCQDMMTRLWSWIGLIVTGTMRQVISVLLRGRRICVTEDMWGTYNKSSTISEKIKHCLRGVSVPSNTNYIQKVYDLKNCGPNNRFLIRQGGTVLMVHNCGYGVGHTKYSNTLLRQGIHLHEDLDRHHELARYAHGIYRAAHPNIVALWRTCERVIQALVNGESGQFGGPNDDLFSFGVIGVGPRQDILVPSVWSKSGYILRYPNLRCEYDGGSKPQYFYDRPRGKNLVKTKIYGGSLTENIIQSFAFVDILMWQGCRMDEHGVSLAANIHDCWAAVPRIEEAEATLHTMEYWMSQVPAYAAGLPIACEGEIGYDFTVV